LHAPFERVDRGAVRAGTRPCLLEFCDSVAGRRDTGIAAVLVQAKDAAAKAFYLAHAEWLEVPAGGWTMWLPVGLVGGTRDHAPYGLLSTRGQGLECKDFKGLAAGVRGPLGIWGSERGPPKQHWCRGHLNTQSIPQDGM